MKLEIEITKDKIIFNGFICGDKFIKPNEPLELDYKKVGSNYHVSKKHYPEINGFWHDSITEIVLGFQNNMEYYYRKAIIKKSKKYKYMVKLFEGKFTEHEIV